jgi:hypothetical protein
MVVLTLYLFLGVSGLCNMTSGMEGLDGLPGYSFFIYSTNIYCGYTFFKTSESFYFIIFTFTHMCIHFGATSSPHCFQAELVPPSCSLILLRKNMR